jgi:hypothetical protein
VEELPIKMYRVLRFQAFNVICASAGGSPELMDDEEKNEQARFELMALKRAGRWPKI